MRRMLSMAFLASVGFANSGCILNEYPSDPNLRQQVLLNESENLRQMRLEWMHFWMTDQPSHLTSERVHGGIL